MATVPTVGGEMNTPSAPPPLVPDPDFGIVFTDDTAHPVDSQEYIAQSSCFDPLCISSVKIEPRCTPVVSESTNTTNGNVGLGLQTRISESVVVGPPPHVGGSQYSERPCDISSQPLASNCDPLALTQVENNYPTGCSVDEVPLQGFTVVPTRSPSEVSSLRQSVVQNDGLADTISHLSDEIDIKDDFLDMEHLDAGRYQAEPAIVRTSSHEEAIPGPPSPLDNRPRATLVVLSDSRWPQISEMASTFPSAERSSVAPSTRKKSVKKHKCPVCNSLMVEDELPEHLKTHEASAVIETRRSRHSSAAYAPKVFPCSQCSFTAISTSELSEHLEDHEVAEAGLSQTETSRPNTALLPTASTSTIAPPGPGRVSLRVARIPVASTPLSGLGERRVERTDHSAGQLSSQLTFSNLMRDLLRRSRTSLNSPNESAATDCEVSSPAGLNSRPEMRNKSVTSSHISSLADIIKKINTQTESPHRVISPTREAVIQQASIATQSLNSHLEPHGREPLLRQTIDQRTMHSDLGRPRDLPVGLSPPALGANLPRSELGANLSHPSESSNQVLRYGSIPMLPQPASRAPSSREVSGIQRPISTESTRLCVPAEATQLPLPPSNASASKPSSSLFSTCVPPLSISSRIDGLIEGDSNVLQSNPVIRPSQSPVPSLSNPNLATSVSSTSLHSYPLQQPCVTSRSNPYSGAAIPASNLPRAPILDRIESVITQCLTSNLPQASYLQSSAGVEIPNSEATIPASNLTRAPISHRTESLIAQPLTSNLPQASYAQSSAGVGLSQGTTKSVPSYLQAADVTTNSIAKEQVASSSQVIASVVHPNVTSNLPSCRQEAGPQSTHSIRNPLNSSTSMCDDSDVMILSDSPPPIAITTVATVSEQYPNRPEECFQNSHATGVINARDDLSNPDDPQPIQVISECGRSKPTAYTRTGISNAVNFDPTRANMHDLPGGEGRSTLVQSSGRQETSLRYRQVNEGVPPPGSTIDSGQRNYRPLIEILDSDSSESESSVEFGTASSSAPKARKKRAISSEDHSDLEFAAVDPNYIPPSHEKLPLKTPQSVLDDIPHYEAWVRKRFVGRDTDKETPRPGNDCYVCGDKFDTDELLKKHCEQSLSDLQCCKCKFKAITKGLLKRHTNKHTNRPYTCDECDASFNKRRLYVQHFLAHKGDYYYKCDGCGMGFQDYSRYEAHVNKENNIAPYKCVKCNLAFASKGHLFQHNGRKHNRQARVQCTVCKKTIGKHFLADHMKRHETADQKTFLCEHCGKVFKTKLNLKNHELQHTGLKPYVCAWCGAAYGRSAKLKMHERKHTGERPYKCNECGKTFGYYSPYMCHLRIHTGERPYKCEYCGMTFAQPSPYAVHKRQHTGERPYQCKECPEAFASHAAVRNHMRTHENSASGKERKRTKAAMENEENDEPTDKGKKTRKRRSKVQVDRSSDSEGQSETVESELAEPVKPSRRSGRQTKCSKSLVEIDEESDLEPK